MKENGKTAARRDTAIKCGQTRSPTEENGEEA
jgi:hypothetical protein